MSTSNQEYAQEYTQEEATLTRQDILDKEKTKRDGTAQKASLPAIQIPNTRHGLFSAKNKMPPKHAIESSLLKHRAH